MEQMSSEGLLLKPIARYEGLLPEKFGLPRQSGLVPELTGQIVFLEGFRMPEALRGLDTFSHIWLIWEFSQNKTWSPTVRPPRFGGNKRLGVFATRTPFRPNPLGLSVVKLEKILWDSPTGPRLVVSGADLMDGTPIYDIKPYVPYADIREEATCGFAPSPDKTLDVDFPESLLNQIPEAQRRALIGVLAQDPRPHYQNDPGRIYGMDFGSFNIKFKVADTTLSVIAVERRSGIPDNKEIKK
ncbi:MAG: tRNA (N6-threonylcarbamoyladenosine(37)-N6)-methyltransferase TrmO [Acidaminococcus sp.]|jgi:tRNA-Thr(GGU) m(6)t(6)A37 methyltransferase TsaA|nr:tRNA (N6-threonylcarbamoyladenosine(37)-N6)-methyltransferase TrmO [Acidaminococcus sp.]MCI2100833.1 tRNA (N6-threonylcarbamoyladenosine(37)-N6)-methyltransferase TrmO [Acidaminococcus sp.]MCI2115196.1 tRNA (N6-threonylcarbamoyladenosine(37)-N6)-methyltransferase TrmO [Acidaminococcus sp.]MCI2117271.1 tRNA (N6-threonylcarbamoyladenosine(37)-N6)-methyltransferase TrmO [Acidaminococcus sp.]